MDAVIFLLISVFMAWRVLESPDTVDSNTKTVIEPEDTTTRIAKLNDTFYEDEDAFMEIAHALGFPRSVR